MSRSAQRPPPLSPSVQKFKDSCDSWKRPEEIRQLTALARSALGTMSKYILAQAKYFRTTVTPDQLHLESAWEALVFFEEVLLESMMSCPVPDADRKIWKSLRAKIREMDGKEIIINPKSTVEAYLEYYKKLDANKHIPPREEKEYKALKGLLVRELRTLGRALRMLSLVIPFTEQPGEEELS